MTQEEFLLALREVAPRFEWKFYKGNVRGYALPGTPDVPRSFRDEPCACPIEAVHFWLHGYYEYWGAASDRLELGSVLEGSVLSAADFSPGAWQPYEVEFCRAVRDAVGLA